MIFTPALAQVKHASQSCIATDELIVEVVDKVLEDLSTTLVKDGMALLSLKYFTDEMCSKASKPHLNIRMDVLANRIVHLYSAAGWDVSITTDKSCVRFRMPQETPH